jgi:hypothetical protein
VNPGYQPDVAAPEDAFAPSPNGQYQYLSSRLEDRKSL